MKPKHHKANYFYRKKLFKDVLNFKELELRISKLPQEERGDAFEVFAEAYFAIQPIMQATNVIPEKSMSNKIKQQFVLEETDHGVDGIYFRKDGTITAYQVKFRSNRTKLLWDELATFCGQSDRFDNRIIITNSDDVSDVAKKRLNMNCINGNDLDNLDTQDFFNINQWLGGNTIKYIKKSPRKHQQEALDAIIPALQKADRSTAVMACGTGKTLVALWAMEHLQAKNIIVLLPSLALLHQTLHSWLKETTWKDLSYICVCSDTTVVRDADEILMNQIDLDFPVTTDSNVVKQFLANATGTKIVFSTYQSASVVAGAVGNFKFDYGIFDEAHKTAGRDGTNFAFALTDNNLAIDKRLFLTATPKHYSLKKNKDGDTIEIYSMNNTDVYGNIDYTLSFAEAAKRDIICNYKVIISVVTSEEVNEKMLKKSDVIVNGEEVNARHVANQIALQKAIEKYGTKKIFTFHQTVKAAEFFASSDNAGIKNYLNNFDTFYVSGAMPTDKRKKLIQDFANCEQGLMSNARCLTEGVDVPAVDMVAFMSPKKSKVDIIQAVGRAMRKSEGKECGYILLPLFLEINKDESIEDALARTDYCEIWDVLQALQTQDEDLAITIKQMREEKGRTGSCTGNGLKEKVEVIGQLFNIDDLRRIITAQCVERLGSYWDEMYGKLKEYKKINGDCNVPKEYKNDPSLGAWVTRQRSNNKYNKLQPEKKSKLDSIEFLWESPVEAYWIKMYEKLKEYKKINGDCNVPRSKIYKNNKKLGIWVFQQRRKNKSNNMEENKKKLLDLLDFEWELFDANNKWDEMYEKLKEYKKINGDCNVPKEYKNDPELGKWVGTQRFNNKSGKILIERKKLLDLLEFEWDLKNSYWNEMYKKLVSYKNKYGNCNVKSTYSLDRQFANWVWTQRKQNKKNKILKERKDLLDAINFWEGKK